MKTYLVFIFSLLFLLCVQSQAIIKGADADLVKSASSVYLEFEALDAACTGVIISSNLILTAGHCFDDQSKDMHSVDVSNSHRGSKSKKIHLAQNFSRHPLYIKPSSGGKKKGIDIQYDIAYMKTKENLLEKFAITEDQLPHLFTSVKPLVDQINKSTLAMVYGYGLNKKNQSKSDEKRELPVTVAYVSEINTVKATSTLAGQGMCEGDSGGGLFFDVDGQTYLAGILSGRRTDVPCGDPLSYAHYSIVSQSICWVLKDSGTPIPSGLADLKCD